MLRLLILLVLVYQLSILFVECHNFSFPSFDVGSYSNLTCWGSVTAANGTLNLTPDQPQNNSNKVGRVLFSHSIPVWPASFSTIFTIRISTHQLITGDGMAFLIAQDDKPSPPDSYGSFIGILDPSTQGGTLDQLAVEFDTYRNEHEIDGNHVAVVTTSMESPVAVKSLNDVGIDLRSGRNITIKIDYDGWPKVLEISVAYAGQPLVNFLRQEIIMQETVPRNAYVGFSASTAYFSEVHHVLNWNFTLFELPEGSLKYGADPDKEDIALLVATPIAIVSLVVVVSFLITARKDRKERFQIKEDIEMLTRTAASGPQVFTYQKLSKATKGFSKDNLLGTGGFGSVYKGVFYDSPTTVAVKQINATSKQGEKEYLAEICTIGRLKHKNLLQLLGWCHDGEKLLLVYEYMPNGSLDKYIGKIFLDWDTRFKILSGLASSLVYLHEECGNPIVHRDIKPNNVMLDTEYNAHLGDFGLARLLQNENFVTTMVAGTPGYLAPEVCYTGRTTPESDVYSFGMVVLEVVCGRRSKGIMEENSLVDKVWSSYEKGTILECMDQTLDGKFDNVQAQRCFITGLACLHPDRTLRPKMRKVVQVFMNPDEPLMKLPESRPSLVCVSWHSPTCSTITTSLDNMKHIPDEVTVSYEDASQTKKLHI
ncbi:probable L-type lectin-domain containing receptor kinase S.5 [Solanum stenotomum]|uniref:probable L-type lectin-domain containing receptor kinase S.5 n=1 Tax=Solanum stenotomum TaxID=172797 RepID=UPI0020D124B7|nr:probable L-type lectin-domain containing receptor kinase S.5 [Solanum stenotomum]